MPDAALSRCFEVDELLALAGVAANGADFAGDGGESEDEGIPGVTASRTAAVFSLTRLLLFSPKTPFCARTARRPLAAVINAAVAVRMPGIVAHQLPVFGGSSAIG